MTNNLDTNKQSLRAFYFHEPFEENHWPEILDEIYSKKVYQKFLPHGEKDTICVSIGANVGLASYYFSQHFSKVYAVEPAKQHLEALTAMIKQNNLANVTVVPYAAANKNGKEKFYHNENQTMFSLEANVNKPDDFEEVDTITMDTLFEKYKIDHVDLCKIDVEGSECQLINSEGFKKVADKIKVIAGEFHQWAACSPENFQHALEELGFEFHWRRDTQAQVFEAVRV